MFCNNLQHLNLSTNIGADGAIALADGLEFCNNLRVLDLYGNNIGAEGALALADGLESSNNLQGLDLYGNNIGAEYEASPRAHLKWHL